MAKGREYFTYQDKQVALDQAWEFIVEKNEEREIIENQMSLFDVQSSFAIYYEQNIENDSDYPDSLENKKGGI